ncbi:AAEL017084-PA [Aedes aegypti]|uniref:AAEL017084-PA n=1 Tax=Aedes aegypti TaxID=7159 RepID=J9HJG1_AEDAE|nr:AAEL017084-PA [Aedes aegypti]
MMTQIETTLQEEQMMSPSEAIKLPSEDIAIIGKSIKPDQICKTGYSFEARTYTEGPAGKFLPETGLLKCIFTPVPAKNHHNEVFIHYDPMIAKLDVWRVNCPKLLIIQLHNYQFVGLQMNINFLIDLARHGPFQVADVHTGFIDLHMETLFSVKTVPVTADSAIQGANAGSVN